MVLCGDVANGPKHNKMPCDVTRKRRKENRCVCLTDTQQKIDIAQIVNAIFFLLARFARWVCFAVLVTNSDHFRPIKKWEYQSFGPLYNFRGFSHLLIFVWVWNFLAYLITRIFVMVSLLLPTHFTTLSSTWKRYEWVLLCALAKMESGSKRNQKKIHRASELFELKKANELNLCASENALDHSKLLCHDSPIFLSVAKATIGLLTVSKKKI